MEEIAKKHGVTMAQIATAWSLTKVTAPIVGTTSLKNLQELAGKTLPFGGHILKKSNHHFNPAAVHIELTEDDIKALEEPYGPQAVFGHW